MGPRKDPWHRSETDEPDQEAGKAKELDEEKAIRQAREPSTDEELKPMHPKDTKPPPEFDGARKDFMPWHESFTSMLRFRSAKWTKIIDWLKAKREKMLLDGQSKADFLAYSQTHRSDEYIEKNFDIFSKHIHRYLFESLKKRCAWRPWQLRRAECSRHTSRSCT